MDTITIRLPDGVLKSLHALSKANNRSMNGQVVELIQKAVKPIPKPNQQREE